MSTQRRCESREGQAHCLQLSAAFDSAGVFISTIARCKHSSDVCYIINLCYVGNPVILSAGQL